MWSGQEISYLLDNYGLMTSRELAIKMARNATSIRMQARKLGLSKPRTKYETPIKEDGIFKIRLTGNTYNDLYVIVDKASIAAVLGHRWSGQKNGNKIFAKTRIAGRTVFMHNLLCPSPPDGVVKHRDGDGLNNRMNNLDIVPRTVGRPPIHIHHEVPADPPGADDDDSTFGVYDPADE